MQYQGTLFARMQRASLVIMRFAGLTDDSLVPRYWRLLVSIPLATLLLAGAANAANVQYSYDAAGRLNGVIDQNGNAAIYNYDASGNITSIVRPAAGSIDLLGFSPASGTVGISVTITGTGFSATPAQNTVKFNGTTATVTSATATQVVATVPTGATSGAISVTSPAGIAASGQSFTVSPPNAAAPSISGFTPTSGGNGDVVTISGSGFATTAAQETVSFGGAFGIVTATSPNSITVTVPGGGVTGPIVVSTQSGSGSSAASFYVIPGGYSSVDTGAITSISAYGQSAMVNASNTNAGYIVKFNGTAGDRVSVNVLDGGSNMTLANAEIFDPKGALVFGPVGTQTITAGNPYNPGFVMGPFVLPLTGTYSVVIAPQNGSTGTAVVSVYHVPADISAALVSGTTTNMALTTPGQNATYTFSGTAGHKALLRLSGPAQTYVEGSYTLYAPNGAVIAADNQLDVLPNGTTVNLGPYPLSQTGIYKLVIDPYQSYLFTGSLVYYDDPPDPVAVLTAGGAPATLTVGTQGQSVDFTFTGTAGQRVSFIQAYNLVSGNCAFGTLYNPDGSSFQALNSCGSPEFFGPYTLTQTGTYKLIVTPTALGTGTVTMTLFNDPPDSTSALVSGGPAVTETAGTPGQGVDYTFSGTVGQRVSFYETYTLSSGSCAFGTLYNPDGSAAQNLPACGSPTFFGPFTLTQSGTYKVVVAPTSGGTGTVAMTLYNVPPDPVGGLVAGGAAVTQTAATPGESVDFTFNGSGGQKISISESSSVSGNNCVFDALYNPDGTVYQNFGALCGPTLVGPFVLTETGTYKYVVSPNSGATGTVTVKLYNVPADPVATLTVGGSAATLTAGTPGQATDFVFSGSAGATVHFAESFSIVGSSCTNGAIYNPNGTVLQNIGANCGSSPFGPYTLTQSGTQKFVVTPLSGATGTVTVSVTSP